MSDSFVTAFPETAAPGFARDLLARLYHEVGLAAVAAALDLPLVEGVESRETIASAAPAALISEDLAA